MPRERPSARPGWGSVHPLLDLHGLTAEEAAQRTERWLRDQRERGERTVVVVTGRGNRSPGPPVLRTEVEHLLHGLRGDLVAGWAQEPGGGAFRVTLAPRPAIRRTAAERELERRLSHADPALRARAEAALWELGIRPTPALVDAEMRRLRAEAAGSAEE